MARSLKGPTLIDSKQAAAEEPQEGLQEKLKDMQDARASLVNILQGAKIKRFAFTESEELAVDFAIDLLDANLEDLLSFTKSEAK